jgi:esterase/lipase superfamily enzyme
MAKIDLFFATNRNRLPDQNGRPAFGALAAPGAQGIAFGTCTVDNVNDRDPGGGTISALDVVNFGGIGPELRARILPDAGHDVLVFIHGAANTFGDAMQRAAFNTLWINQLAGRPVTTIAFSWPAMHYNIGDIAGDLRDYRADQAQAGASGAHFVEFLTALYQLKAAAGGRRLTLLAHSMGNFMLGFGVEHWFATPRGGDPLFDQVVLAAADEFADTFGRPNGGRLSDLRLLARHISVYTSRVDVLMHASRLANGGWRLGYDGPPNRADATFFPPATYDFVDCTANQDYLSQSGDETHQYYRESATVRADIARVLKGQPAPRDTRSFNTVHNVSTLPPVSVLASNPVAPVA